MSTKPDTHDLNCSRCGLDIVPGDERSPTPDGVMHTACRNRRDAAQHYRFFLCNPVNREAYSMALFYTDGDREYPILQNTGGLNSIMSASTSFGDDRAVSPTPHFLRAIAYAYHWLQSYRPLPTDHERIREEIDKELPKYYPNGKIPSHERWAAHIILNRLYLDRSVPPEFGPIVECCDDITAFGVPTVEPYE